MNITLKNVPAGVYRTMRREAKRNRRSLNAQIIRALETEAEEMDRRRELKAALKDLDRFVATLPPMSDSTRLIREERERH
jgi:hypothetical protein